MATNCKYIVIEEEWFKERRKAKNGVLRGNWQDQGELAQVWVGNRGQKSQRVGAWVRHTGDDAPLTPTHLQEDELLLVIRSSEDATPSFSVYQKKADTLVEVESELVRLHSDYAARLKGLFDTEYLKAKKVAVVGLGSGGSRTAFELAKCGVGHFKLIDYDRLQAHNLARHICGREALGRYKTKAVADTLVQANPGCKVETLELDILEEREEFANFIEGCDIVIAATDSEASRNLINQLCWNTETPSLYGAAWNRAFGGEIVRVIPPYTACYHCYQLYVSEFFEDAPRSEEEIDYGTLGNEGKLKAEPGLGIDVNFIALILAKAALLLLLQGSESELEDLPTNHIIWGNRAIWIFEKPLESLFVEVERNADCVVCQPETYVKQKLGMGLEKAQQLTDDLVRQARKEENSKLTRVLKGIEKA